MLKSFIHSQHFVRLSALGIIVAAIHAGLILFLTGNDFTVSAAPISETFFKIADIREQAPPPAPDPPPPPPPRPKAVNPELQPVLPKAPAENIIVSEDVPEKSTEESAQEDSADSDASNSSNTADEYADYLPQHKISQKPKFNQNDLIVDYPPLAQRSGIEGIVYLELYIDKQGYVRKVVVLKETPPAKGFGEAAVRAFENKKCKPAEANGTPVAVRYRYPVRFIIN